MKKIFIAIAFMAGLSACTAKFMVPEQSDADKAQSKYPGTTLADISHGKALIEQHCDKCHSYKAPKSRGEADWNVTIPKMVKKINGKAGSTVLSAKDEKDILAYMVVMGKGK